MPLKLTIEIVKDRFAVAGCTLISTEYLSSLKPLKYKCSCGTKNIHEITINDFKRGMRCPDCREDRKKATTLKNHGVEFIIQKPGMKEKMMRGIKEYVEKKKYKIEEVKDIFEKENCKLLSTSYINSTTPLEIEFECGCIGSIALTYFLRGQRCNIQDCMNKKKIATNIEKFGVDWYQTTEEAIERVKQTNLQKYGVTHPSKLPEYIEKIKKINLQKYGKEHYFQTDEFKEKKKKKCLDEYGCEYYSQVEFVREKIKESNMKLYGVPCSSQASEVKNKMIQTNLQRYNVPYTLVNKMIKAKANKTILDKYGVDNISKSQPYQLKKIQTSLKNHGTEYPMQNAIIAERSSSRAFSTKDYTLPSGRIIKIQGYENMALDLLLEEYDEEDFEFDKSKIPEYWYFEENKYRRYFPDFWLPEHNLIIEVKSIYTYNLEKKTNDIKRKAVEYNGQIFKLMILCKNKQHIKV
jgi:hypothetical protein